MKAEQIARKLRELGVPSDKAEAAGQRFGDDSGQPAPAAELLKVIRRAERQKAVEQHRREFRVWCRANGLPNPTHEYVFAKQSHKRQWRFDWCWPDVDGRGGVALEIEGGIYSGGRHVRGKGYEEDARKYSVAATLGWRVIRRTTGQMFDSRGVTRPDAETLDLLQRVLCLSEHHRIAS